MSGFRAFGKHVVVMIIAAALFGVALIGLAAGSDAAPYPPSEPCSVSATARGAAAEDGTTDYDVVGSGLDAAQPVRVVLAATGQQVGSAETDTSGNFQTVVAAPLDPDNSAPALTAFSAQRTCSTPPPSEPSSQPSGSSGTSVPAGTGNPTRSTASTERPSSPDAGTVPGGTGGSGSTDSGTNGGATNPTPGRTGTSTSGGTDAGAGTSGAPSSTATTGRGVPDGGTASSKPPLAEPLPGTDTPFGIGLGIAAVLLVLGTLAVLLLTRRPER